MILRAFVNIGWTPTLALVADGARRVIQVVSWSGGTGPVPAVGVYLGPTGFVNAIEDATDVGGSPISISNGEPENPSLNQIWIQI